jgi:Fe2+ or Zn2+ uptake regulation protein
MTNYFDVKTWQDRFRLACFECGETEEYSSSEFDELKQVVASRTGFEIRVTTLEIRGKCRQCQERQGHLPGITTKRLVN